MVAQAIVYEFCASGAIDRSIATVKAALADRVATLDAALQEHLPEARYTPPEGGYFMWVELPEGTDVDALFDAANERGVAFVKGTDFLLEGGENTLRLAYSGVTADQIDEGIRRLADAYRSLAPRRAGSAARQPIRTAPRSFSRARRAGPRSRHASSAAAAVQRGAPPPCGVARVRRGGSGDEARAASRRRRGPAATTDEVLDDVLTLERRRAVRARLKSRSVNSTSGARTPTSCPTSR